MGLLYGVWVRLAFFRLCAADTFSEHKAVCSEKGGKANGERESDLFLGDEIMQEPTAVQQPTTNPPTNDNPQNDTPQLTSEQMLDALVNAAKPQAQPEEETDPNQALTEDVFRIRFQLALDRQWEETKTLYPEMTRGQFNEMKLAESQGEIAKAENIRIQAAKRGLEVSQETRKQELKDVHTEGAGSGATDNPGLPKNLDDAESRANARFGN